MSETPQAEIQEPPEEALEQPVDDELELEPVSGRAAGEAIGARLAAMVDAGERQALAEEAAAQLEPGEEPPADPRARNCSVCRGWGMLQTGSLVEGQATRTCWHCGGIGFEEAQLVGPATPLVASDQLEPAPPAEAAPSWVWPQATGG